MRRYKGCPCAGHGRFQLAPKHSCCWSKLSEICDAGGISAITCLVQAKKSCAVAVRERSKKNVKETAQWTPELMRKEWEEELQACKKRVRSSSQRRLWWSMLTPLDPMEDSMLQQVDMPEETRKRPGWSHLLAEMAACGGDARRKWVVWQETLLSGTCGSTTLNIFRNSLLLKDCSPWNSPKLAQRRKDW